MSREAMKLALEALETAWTYDEDNADGYYFEAITALREALAEQPAQQEPVAWMYDWICDGKLLEGWIAHKESEIPRLLASNIRPLYTSPPAQRKPLTDEEIEQCMKQAYATVQGRQLEHAFARAIEARLKELNT